MKTTFKTRFAVIATALAIFTLLGIQPSYTNNSSAQAINETQTSSPESDAGIETATTAGINVTTESFGMIEDHAMLTSSRKAFRPRLIVTYSRPNFSRPIRRADIKRKGRIQH
jgi:hypothetical protein